MENFVRDYGTGNSIPEPPVFVNYANTDAPPVSSTRVATRPANFSRSTQRVNRTAALPPDDEAYDDANHAGLGAGGSGGPSRSTPTDAAPLSRSATHKSTSPPSQANGVNGHVSPSREPQRRHSTALVKPVSHGDPVDPTVSNTQLVIGDRVWDVDPSKDPQQQKTSQARTSPPVSEQDPLVKQMAELSTAAARRNTIRRDGPPSSTESRKGTADSLSTPPTTTSPSSAAPRDFRNSAEVVVGSYPLAQSPSRSASPNPPIAALVAPPPPSIPPSASNIPVEQVVSGYSRPFPGEPRSRANSYVGPPPIVNQNQEHGVSRPTSRAGYPGIGTQSLVPRPTSPAKGQGPNLGTVQPYNRGVPTAPNVPPGNGSLHRGMSVSHRPVTPTNPVGIALGPDGRVVHDMMVQSVRQQGGHYGQGAPPPPPPAQVQTQAYGYHDAGRALTHPQQQQQQQPQMTQVQAPPPPRGDYAYGSPQAYPHGHVPQHAPYERYHPQAQAYPQAPPPPPPAAASAPVPQTTPYGNYDYGAVARSGTYHHHPGSQSVGHIGTTPRGGYMPGNVGAVNTMNPVYRPTSPGVGMGRSPSPAAPRGQGPPPTGTYTDNGRPILFYGACVSWYSWGGVMLMYMDTVKALYDYSATIDEEFDFQAGDIIAVTDTPEDGWWSGELLDDTRRQAGRHVFPSNFVCLF